MAQVRLEVQELEARAEVAHRQSLESVEQAAECSVADAEQRAERNHLEKVASLEQEIVSKCERSAAVTGVAHAVGTCPTKVLSK